MTVVFTLFLPPPSCAGSAPEPDINSAIKEAADTGEASDTQSPSAELSEEERKAAVRKSFLDVIEETRQNYSITGSLEHKTFGYAYRTKQDPRKFYHQGALYLEASKNMGDNLRWYIAPEIRCDNAHFFAGAMDEFEDKREERRYLVNLREAYVAYYGKTSDIFVGKRIYSWGKADAFNPIDRLNPKDYFDVLDNEKIGIFSVAASQLFNSSSLTLVYVPTFTPSRLPNQHNRWSGNPEGSITEGSQFNINNVDVEGSILKRRRRPRTLKNSQVGLLFQTTLKGWDFALSAYDGIEPVSVVQLEPGTPAIYAPLFNPIRSFGGGFSTILKEWEVHGECAQVFTDGNKDDDYFQYIFGTNRSWHDFIIWEKVSLYLEYAGESVTSSKGDANYIASQGYVRPFQNSLLGKVAFKFDQDLELMFRGTFDLDDEDYYFSPKITYKFTDHLKFKIGLDILGGRQNSFLGKWNKNDRISTHVIYSF